jgi:hypothetical protein
VSRVPPTSRPLLTRDRFLAAFGADPVPVGAALAAGFTEAQLRSTLARGLLVRVRHGVVAASVAPELGDRAASDAWRAQHLVALRAALQAVGPGAMAAHCSAAVVVDVSTPRAGPPTRVELARPGAANFDGPGLRVRGSGVPHHHRTEVDGIPTTDLIRTAVDLARGQSLPAALIPLDAGARRMVAGGEDRARVLRERVHDLSAREAALERLAACVEECCGWPGIAAVRRALEHLDPASESPLESRSRGWFLEAGLPSLLVGHPIPTQSGLLWADFCDPVRRVIGEADGWSKYGSDLESVRAAIEAEKQRQAELEDGGWRVVRWTSRDRRASVVSRMATALASRN